MKLLDLFCGKWGWSRAFAARGWDCVGVDLVAFPPPERCTYRAIDILTLTAKDLAAFDFIVASSPCEQFSIHGMKHFHPHPKPPDLGLILFEHTRAICEASGKPYVMENVRAAQQFVGRAAHHCGPFYLWGNAVPVLMPQGIQKGIAVGSSKAVKGMTREEKRVYRAQFQWNQAWSSSKRRQRDTAQAACIPDLLANAVADYAEAIIAERLCP